MLLAVAALAAAGCGADGSSDVESAAELQTTTTTAAPTTTTAAPTTTTTAAPTTTTTTTTAAPTTTAASTASAPGDEETASVPGDEETGTSTASATAPADVATAESTAPESAEAEQAAMDAWSIVFDSEADFADKVPHLENAAQLESTVTAYAETGASFGGVSLEPTAVSIDGDVAAVTYDVLFGGSAAYSDLSGAMQLVDGVWVVGRDTFCGFMASARTPCQD